MQRILAYCLLGMTALLIAIGGAAYALIAHLEAQQATATLNALTLHTQAQFELLGDRIEQEELSLQSHWQNTLPAIVQQLNIDPFAASPQKLSQIARDLHVDAVSLINRDAQIVVSSLNQEGDLNFATLPSALGEQLKKNIGSGQHLKHHLDVSLKTGQLMLYHYYAPEGQNYFLQTAIALKPLLQRQQILSNHHPDAWFKVGAAAALPVHQIDLLLPRASGNYSILTERLVAPRSATVFTASTGVSLIGLLKQHGRYDIVLPLGEKMAFANAVLAVDLDLSMFQRAKSTLLMVLLLIWLIGMWAAIWWLRRSGQYMVATAVQIVKQSAIGQQPKLEPCWQALQQYALEQHKEQSELARLQGVELTAMAYAQQQKHQSLEAEIVRRRDSEATLAELRLGLEMANRRLIEVNTSLIHDAETDPLTSCGNRRMFEHMAAAEISRAIRYAHPVCLLMLDIDFFKRVNDEFGHPMGDQVLIYLADLLRKQIRPSDRLFRWGGEEFVLLVPGVSLEQGRILAEKLRQNVADAVFPHQLPLTISLGVALFTRDVSVEEWVKRADTALYTAKTNGRNRVELAI